MNIEDWIPAIITTGLLGGLTFLFRSLISTRLTQSVKHEFNEDLEKLKSEFRRNEEQFKAEIRSRDTQIEALRSGALAALVSRQRVLDERTIAAVDQLWSQIPKMSTARMAAMLMSTVKFDASTEESIKNENFRQVFEIMGSGVDMDVLKQTDASALRPFLSDIAWALFSAYQGILFYAVGQLETLKSGIDGRKLMDEEKLKKVVIAALPLRKDYVEKYGSTGCYHLLEELESILLFELRNILKGEESDKETIERAAKILSQAEDLVMESVGVPKISD